MLRSTMIARRLIAFSAEITVGASLGFAKSALANQMTQLSKTFDMTGTPYERRSMSVPTAATALPLGDVTTPGWCFIINLDPTNYVEVLISTGLTALIKLKPGEFAVFRFAAAAVAPAVKANTAAVLIDYLLLQD